MGPWDEDSWLRLVAMKVRMRCLWLAMAMAGVSAAGMGSRYSLLASDDAARREERGREASGSKIAHGVTSLADLFHAHVPASCSWNEEDGAKRYTALPSGGR